MDHHERIDVVFQFVETAVGLIHAFATFRIERQGDYPYRQDAAVACRLGYDRCGSGTRTAAHAGRDEYHFGAFLFETQHYVVKALYCRGTSLGGVVACAEPFAQLYLYWNGTGVERLSVGVADHERNVGYAEVVHVVDGVSARAADTQYHDYGRVFLWQVNAYDYFVFVCHCRGAVTVFRRRRLRRKYP